MNTNTQYQIATLPQLEARWDINIANNPGDPRWLHWKATAIKNHQAGKALTFVALHHHIPIGEATLILNLSSVEINGLRVDEPYQGQGHASKLVQAVEAYAKKEGYSTAIIGVEPKETRNLAIYLKWGYDQFVKLEITDPKQDEGLLLYYAKNL